MQIQYTKYKRIIWVTGDPFVFCIHYLIIELANYHIC
jgi:hypothetical protein